RWSAGRRAAGKLDALTRISGNTLPGNAASRVAASRRRLDGAAGRPLPGGLMRGFAAVMRQEVIHIRREPRLGGYVLGLPGILRLLLGFALRLRVEPLAVAVVDQDRTFLSLQVRDRLARESDLVLVEVDSEDAIHDLLDRGRVHVGVVIPHGF